MVFQLLWKRAVCSLTTFPTIQGWYRVVGITVITTTTAGIVATATEFVHPIQDFHPPTTWHQWGKATSVFFFPSLVEEVIWRGALLPRPSQLPLIPTRNLSLRTLTTTTFSSSSSMLLSPSPWTPWWVLLVHVISHPLAGHLVWPRGKDAFCDVRFLLLATIVLGGATLSFLVTGGSVWAATITHALPVLLWRDFFLGEERLALSSLSSSSSSLLSSSQTVEAVTPGSKKRQ